LLGERGLFVVDGGVPALKKLAAPLWTRIIEVGPALHKLLYGRDILLSKSGFAPVLSPTPSAYLFYLTDKQPIRQVVNYDGTVRKPDDRQETVTLNELHERVVSHPEDLSPKAALRPLYQDFVLPTVAYIASPDEVAYHAQIQPFYETLSVVAPTIFPRMSVTLVDEKTMLRSQKLGLGVRDVLRNDLDTLSKRILENTDAHQRLRTVCASLKPRGLLNEQGLSAAYFLMRYGKERLLAALDEVPLEAKRHAIVLLPN
jgi:uncharacterized protein YllA (UPF0747 family)